MNSKEIDLLILDLYMFPVFLPIRCMCEYMHKIKYLIYKIFNNILCKKLKKIAPMFFSKRINFENKKYFRIDLLHSTTHLGDRLFFLKLLRLMSLLNIEVELIDDGVTDALYLELYGEKFISVKARSDAVTIVPKPSYIDKYEKYVDLCVIDFTDIATRKQVADQLVDSFCKVFNFENSFDLQINAPVKKNKLELNLTHDKYIVFNNYIDSGFFRKYFINEKKLFLECIVLKEKGFKILHVGSPRDKLLDSKSYNFVDLDLRGELNILDLIGLISAECVKGVVTFDNFIMHIGLIYRKDVKVLFRGRFTRHQVQHHIKHVNNCFLSNINNLTYL